MFNTTFLVNTELGIVKISRSNDRIVVRYQPTSRTMPSTTCPELGLKSTSSPTSKGLDVRMMSPVKRFSKISRPAKPKATPPTPPMARTELTSIPSARTPKNVEITSVPRLISLSIASSRRCLVKSPLSSSCHDCSLTTLALMLNTTFAAAMTNTRQFVDRTSVCTMLLGMLMTCGSIFSPSVVTAAIMNSTSSGR